MRNALLLLAVCSIAVAGCGSKESYDKPDPAPKSNQFETQATGPDKTSDSATKGQTDQAATDN